MHLRKAVYATCQLVQLLLFGFAIDFDVDRVDTALVDHDNTPQSRAFVQGLFADGALRIAERGASVTQGERALEDGTAAVVLYIPHGFAKDQVRGAAEVQVLIDGTDPTRSGVSAGTVAGYISRQLPYTAGPRVEVRSRLLFNPTLSTPVYMVPGIAGILLLLITTVVTAMGLAREREVGTLEQIRVTPLPSGVLMVGKLSPYILIGLLDVTAALGIGAWFFDVPLRGSILLFYAITAAYMLTTVGIGLLISTSQEQAFIGAFMFMLPALLLSGTMTPIHSMPWWLQPFTYLNPLRFYTESVRAILLKGATAADLWLQITALVVMGGLIVFTAARRFAQDAE